MLPVSVCMLQCMHAQPQGPFMESSFAWQSLACNIFTVREKIAPSDPSLSTQMFQLFRWHHLNAQKTTTRKKNKECGRCWRNLTMVVQQRKLYKKMSNVQMFFLSLHINLGSHSHGGACTGTSRWKEKNTSGSCVGGNIWAAVHSHRLSEWRSVNRLSEH